MNSRPSTLSRQVRLSTGTDVAFQIAGSGPALVFLHGWSLAASLFRTQLSHFSTRHTVVLLDFRNHGASPPCFDGADLTSLANDLGEVMALLDLDKPVVVGHSMGAAVCWEHLLLHGNDRIRGLISIDQPPCMVAAEDWPVPQRLAAGSAFTREELDEYCSLVGNPLLRRRFVDAIAGPGCPVQIRQELLLASPSLQPDFAARLLLDAATRDWREAVTQLRVPTLVIAGEHSNVPPQSQQWLAQAMPNATVAVMPDTGHVMFLTHPQSFNRLVEGFIKDI